MLGLHLIEQVVAIFPDGPSSSLVGGFGYRLLLVGFLVTYTFFIARVFSNIEKLHVTTMLWRLFIIGMVGITVIMLITFANRATAGMTIYRYMGPIFYQVGFFAFVTFFLSASFIFRRFILYPRTRRKLFAWRTFLVFLGLGVLFMLFRPGITLLYLTLITYIPILLISLALAANVRWIAYLNFNQKLRALGLFVLIVIVIFTYVIAARQLPSQLGILLDQLIRMEAVLYLLIFTLIYSGFSILVLFFNLPTSSIFEMKTFEIASFNKIKQAIQANLDFSDIMKTLLDASVLTSGAKAGWIEMVQNESEENSPNIELCKGLTLEEVEDIKQSYDVTERVLNDQKYLLVKNTSKLRAFKGTANRYKCLLCVPIVSNNQAHGVVYVVHELENAFEDVAVVSLVSFAEQAGMALENARLMNNSLEMERYQEQLKIAKDVQRELLPSEFPNNDKIEFLAEGDSAYEIGGDYFDVVNPKPDLYRVAIGDVSGKGTTAAFYMAEIKGIFHALTLLDLDVKSFLSTANEALSACMKKGFFMTLTYLQIDTEQRKVEMIRAGHCPTLYYDIKAQKLKVLKKGTLGLGMVRNGSFKSFIKETIVIDYQPGDMIFLHTDGITEARDEKGEEYGFERFKENIGEHIHETSDEIAQSIIHSVKEFTHSEMEDDYTILIIRFK